MQVIKQVLEAMVYYHKEGVLHRDIKPENLRFLHPTKDWLNDWDKATVKIIDFGLATTVKDTPETGWLGSPGALPCNAFLRLSSFARSRCSFLRCPKPHNNEQAAWTAVGVIMLLTRLTACKTAN